jgi:hypothetical protein
MTHMAIKKQDWPPVADACPPEYLEPNYRSGVSLLDRLTARIEVDPESGCWLWTAGRFSNGYGRLCFERTALLAHRVAYELFVGPLQDGEHCHHSCETKACCNPWHLEPLTPGAHKREHWPAHCPRGHPLEGDNLYIDPRGWRMCRICLRASVRAYDAAHRDELNAKARARYAANREEILARQRETRARKKAAQLAQLAAQATLASPSSSPRSGPLPPASW